MTSKHRQELVEIAKRKIVTDDGSHDFSHAWRVLLLAERLAAAEGGDPDVVVPSALFHDLVVHAKTSRRSKNSQRDSAAAAEKVLNRLSWYPKEKIKAVRGSILRCSYSQNLPKESIEEHILQDADLLESTGAISVARTFNSGGRYRRPFYDIADPTHSTRLKGLFVDSLYLFKRRLFLASARLHTKTAKKIAVRRDRFLRSFYREFLRDIAAK